jgi:hypothetical protein
MLKVKQSGFLSQLIFTICALICLMLFGNQVADGATIFQTASVARPVVIYQSSCGNPCASLFASVLPQIQSKYGDRLEIVVVDADLPVNKSVVARLLKEYDASRDSLPVFLIDQTALKGIQPISQQSDALIKTSLDSGSGNSPFAREIAKQSDQLRSALTTAQQTVNQLTQQVQELQVAQSSIQRLTLILALTAGVLFVVVLVTSTIAIRFASQRFRSQQPRQLLLDTRADEAAFIRTLIGQGKYSTDFLGLMLNVSEQYQREGTVGPRAAQLARDFLVMARELLGLAPVENLGTTVTYDPLRHLAYGSFKPGTRVIVVESGWLRHGSILKRASVQMKKEG